ncbi:MAG: D-hexose-6-phosphate mutarotase [Actinomycetota bacterium]|nr:D-hexose-6-phosphate mutarotase [Actinomycetota bacterium]
MRRAISGAWGTGAIYDHGAQLVEWTPDGQAGVLFVSRLARFAPGIAIRGGVPIVLPWFGAGVTGDRTPAHGFARLATWELVDAATAGGTEARVSYALASLAPMLRAEFEVRLGTGLRLMLAVTNTGEQPLQFEEALHTYLAVGDATRIRLTGLDGAEYLDQAAPGGLVRDRQHGEVTIAGEVDRIYDSASTVTVIDPAWQRTIEVSKRGSASTIVWNPWSEKAAALADFGDDEWRGMVCVESGNVRDAAVTLVPGQRHTLDVLISVRAAVC